MAYVALPAFRAPSGLDVSGLSDALGDLATRNEREREKNRLLQESRAIGSALSSGQQPVSQPGYAPQQNALLRSSSSPAQYQAGSLVDKIVGAESGGNANATNPRSSATGAGQFISSTWLDQVKRNRPDLANGRSDSDLLAMRNDPNLSREMTQRYADENGSRLRGAGFEATPGNTYLSHFAGPQGSLAVLKADPSAPVRGILGDRVVQANPFLANMTAGDLRAWADRKMGGQSPQASSQSPAPTSRPSGMNYGAGIRAALQSGNIALATQLQNAQQEEEQTAYTRQRQGVADAQSAESHSLTTQNSRAELEQKLNMRAAGIAQTIQRETDPAKKAQMWGAFVNSHPKISENLRGYGVDPADINAGTNLLIAEARGLQGSENKNGRYHATKQGILDTQTGQVVAGSSAEMAESPEYGTSTEKYIDKDGNLRYTQVSKAGGRKDLELPEGARWAPGVDYKDTGTGFVPTDKRTGQAVGPVIQKNIAEKESAEEVGKARGLAQVALPAAKTSVENSFKTIKELRAHPGLDRATGISNWADPRNWAGGTLGYDFMAKNKQAQGQSFMVARDALKGAGQVTDFEGAKGEQAIANLDAAQSRDQYIAALDTLEVMLQASYDDLQRKAGVMPSASPQLNPQLEATKKKYGLD